MNYLSPIQLESSSLIEYDSHYHSHNAFFDWHNNNKSIKNITK